MSDEHTARGVASAYGAIRCAHRLQILVVESREEAFSGAPALRESISRRQPAASPGSEGLIAWMSTSLLQHGVRFTGVAGARHAVDGPRCSCATASDPAEPIKLPLGATELAPAGPTALLFNAARGGRNFIEHNVSLTRSVVDHVPAPVRKRQRELSTRDRDLAAVEAGAGAAAVHGRKRTAKRKRNAAAAAAAAAAAVLAHVRVRVTRQEAQEEPQIVFQAQEEEAQPLFVTHSHACVQCCCFVRCHCIRLLFRRCRCHSCCGFEIDRRGWSVRRVNERSAHVPPRCCKCPFGRRRIRIPSRSVSSAMTGCSRRISFRADISASLR